MHSDYPEFKAAVYAPIDPRFHWWFYRAMPHTIRLDEIMWGGVKVDGIPPLDHPSVIQAEEASYLGKRTSSSASTLTERRVLTRSAFWPGMR